MASASRRKSSSARRLCGELAEHLARPHALAERGAPLREVGEQRQRGEVALDDVVDAGPLDLHDDALAGAQPRAGRSGRSTPRRAAPSRTRRTPRRRGRRARPRAPGAIASTGSGGDPVLQLGELVADLGRQEVDARRGDLPELDVDAAGLLEHAPEPDADRRRSRRSAGRPTERPEALRRGRAAPARGSGGAPRSAAARRAAAGARRPARRARRSRASRAGPGGRAPPRRPSSPGCRCERVDDEPVGAPVPVGEAQRDEQRAMLQPTTPASSAVPQPRRMPSSRSDDRGRDDRDQRRRRRSGPATTGQRRPGSRIIEPPGHGGAPAPHRREAGRVARPSSTSVGRGAGRRARCRRRRASDAVRVAVERRTRT